jgi:tetratricopeptide (TPR) repeat protein
MEGRNEQLLINYLDRTLEEQEMREVEALINADPEMRKQWQYLQLAVEAVEYSALYDQVAAVKENFRTIQPVEVLQPSSARIVRMRMRRVINIAAACLLLIMGVSSYKYFTVSATGVYQQAFIPYTLPTTRGQATITDIEQAYQAQNWNAVIATVNKTSFLTDNKALFLCGIAHLQLQHYAEATALFEQVHANNSQTGDDLFEDDAEYYGALSDLANGDTQKAITVLQKIRANKDHLYHEQASRIGNIDLQILKIKGGQ